MKILKESVLTGIILLYSFNGWAEKKVTNQGMIWYAYFLNLKINDRFAIYTDIQERHFIHPAKQSQFLFRSSFNTTLTSNWDLGVGLSFALSNTTPLVDYDLEAPELRPHIEVNNRQKLKNVIVWHRYRMEARFPYQVNGNTLGDGFKFSNIRFRYQLALDFIVRKPKEERHALRISLRDEIMLNFGKHIKYNLFDQNRLNIAFQYLPIKQVAIEVGYMHLFQQREAGDAYFNRHILRFAVINNIALAKKEKNQK